MTPDYYDVSTCIEEKDYKSAALKQSWVKLGVAFPGRDGRINIKLQAQPLGGFKDGMALVLFPKTKTAARAATLPSRTGLSTEIDDDIPF